MSNALVVVDAANSLAPPLPSTSRLITPTSTPRLKNWTVRLDGTSVFGSASKPNVKDGSARSISIEVKPLVQSTRGVDDSVSGGAPQEPHVVGTVSATMPMSNAATCVPSLNVVRTVKSGAAMPRSEVPLT